MFVIVEQRLSTSQSLFVKWITRGGGGGRKGTGVNRLSKMLLCLVENVFEKGKGEKNGVNRKFLVIRGA